MHTCTLMIMHQHSLDLTKISNTNTGKKLGHFIQKNATGVVLVHPSLVRAHATLVYIIYTLLARSFAQFILM